MICVYTYDVADEEDCTRVRRALLGLGVVENSVQDGCGHLCGGYSTRGETRVSSGTNRTSCHAIPEAR